MKNLSTTMFLITLFFALSLNIIYAQLPFDPFSAYSGNPVLPADPGTWDELATWWPNVVFVNDTFYMLYNGTTNLSSDPVSIGLATSSDGFTYSKSDSNPILSGDGSGFDAYNAGDGVLVFNNSTWYLYYTGKSSPPNQLGNVISRAISNSGPHGPWIRSDDSLLTVGSLGEWDSNFIGPETIIENGSELIMYYFAGASWLHNPQIGMATSTDGGLTWEKYNDPSTTTPPYIESDPVLRGDKPYDILSIPGCTVIKHEMIWEMFYGGRSSNSIVSICYAISWDGIIWEKDTINSPIFTPFQDPIASDAIVKPSVVTVDSLYFMYYDYNVTSDGIGLATANILSVENLLGSLPSAYSLYQNYPNPFNPSTSIVFGLPEASEVKLTLFNSLGEEVADLFDGYKTAGYHQVEFNATELTSGVYFYQLIAFDPSTGSGQGFCETKKMVLIK